MKHLTDEQLILYRYGEGRDAARVESHLAVCAECRLQREEIEAMLAVVDALPVPERPAEYGSEVWARLRRELVAATPAPLRWQDRWARLVSPPRWAVALAMALLVVAAFLAGRFWPRHEVNVAERGTLQPAEAGISPQARERVLLVAVGDHLERSQMVLIELMNSPRPPRPGTIDISSEQARALDLVASNRLYRETATRAGQAGLADVLDDLERVLIDVAHGPSKVSPSELEDLRKRIEAQGLIFKVRVIDSEVRQRERAAEPAPSRAL